MNQVAEVKQTPITALAERLSIDPDEMRNIVMATVMPNGGKGVTNEQFVSFVAVANNYGLDPLKKEIYAFPAKGGGIQPIVSIDGWLSIINTHPDFDGMTLDEKFDQQSGEIFSVTCSIFKKGIKHPTIITEYLAECYRNTEPWKKKIRMLRHKATIQCGRYAFGLSGIMEQDEAEAALEVDITPAKSAIVRPDKTKKEYDHVWEGKQSGADPELSEDAVIVEETEKVKLIPVNELLEMVATTDSIDDMETIKLKMADYPADSEDRAMMVGVWKEKRAIILRAQDAAALEAKGK